ncbi:MAG: hypothetical protein ABJB05_16900, partial [Parafilimonas sp.]
DVLRVWKNGVAIAPDNTQKAYGVSITISGNDVYLGGTEYNGSRYVAKVWKNGIATNLTDGSKNAGVSSVFVK